MTAEDEARALGIPPSHLKASLNNIKKLLQSAISLNLDPRATHIAFCYAVLCSAHQGLKHLSEADMNKLQDVALKFYREAAQSFGEL